MEAFGHVCPHSGPATTIKTDSRCSPKNSKHRTFPNMLAFLLLMLCLTKCVTSQTLRPFPPLFNAAKLKDLTTVPSQSTCGIPVRSAYCKSSTFAYSINECIQAFCVQECPRRTSLPTPQNMLLASGYGVCVTADTINTRPGSGDQDYTAIFSAGSLCFLNPQSRPTLGANGAFTVTFWMWQKSGNTGTVIEKYTSSRETILRVRVGSTGLYFNYRTLFGQREVFFPDTIPPQNWVHVAVQVYDTTLSYYINGTGIGLSARGTSGLVGTVLDAAGSFRLGQAKDDTDQFAGRLQNVYFYQETLTNREIEELHSGTLPDVRIQTLCRCPQTHPRVKPLDTSYCIRNGVPDNIGDDVLRLNNDSHPLEYLNDGDSNSIWTSTFLNDVTIEVNLGDEFQVFYVVLQFYSPQAQVVTIERKIGNEWQRWQYYADDCAMAFGMTNNGPLTTSTSVNCIQIRRNSVPYSKGNITYSVLAPEPVARPGHNDFYNTPALYEFVKASAIRVRLQGQHYISPDDVFNRHRYFGVYEFIVTGRCNCHGHGETCDTTGLPYICDCLAESFTDGNQCERCMPLYNDKPFRIGDQISAYNCKLCECYGHADSCMYNQTVDPFPDDQSRGGGGQCVNCQDNTIGRMCDECASLHFREIGKSLYAKDVCSPCDCNMPGVEGSLVDCARDGGQCTCKRQVEGRRCDQCKAGYFNLQVANPVGCEQCGCLTPGTVGGDISCEGSTGQCNCKVNVRGTRCDDCKFGYYNLDASSPEGCTICACNPQGSRDQFCNPIDGQCQCQENIQGRRCDECLDGFFDFSGGCNVCDCDFQGTIPGTSCDKNTGQCTCKANVMGARCDTCKDGFYDLGGDTTVGCAACGCEMAGTVAGSQICDKATGECECKENVIGRNCNQCKPNTYGLSGINRVGCATCNCDPSGTQAAADLPPNGETCDQNTGQCACLTNRAGRRCEECADGFFINPDVSGGCNPCNCNAQGAVANVFCDRVTGQCQCKSADITGRACDQCADQFYGSPGSCKACLCDLSGSKNSSCHPTTGQCFCKDFTQTRQCGQCVPGTSNLERLNPFGCSKAPNQQPPPRYIPRGPTFLTLNWAPPDYPNGVIIQYILYRDGAEIAVIETGELEYNDTALSPFTEYQYVVEAVNDFGSTRSPTVTFKTPSGAPQGEVTLMVSDVTSRTAFLQWNQPSSANGIIQSYNLSSTRLNGPPDPFEHYKGLSTNILIQNMEAYTNYTFVLGACTTGGCITSNKIVLVTREDYPEQQGAVTITPLSSSELYVEWDPPAKPNGIIIYYELWMRGALRSDGSRDPPERRLFHPSGQYNPLPMPTDLDPPATNFTAMYLDPYTVYEFQIFSQNSIGKSSSVWVSGRTLETSPLSTRAPVIYAVSGTELNVTWEKPDVLQTRGEIVSYTVYQYKETDLFESPFAPPWMWKKVYQGDNETLHVVLPGFNPYSNHSFRLESCNSISCVNSSEAYGITGPGVPEGLRAPFVEGVNSTRMGIQWHPPLDLNAPAVNYTVRRTRGSFSHPPPKVGSGIRFPGFGFYKFPPDTIPQGVSFSGFELEFKTSHRNGLLLFAATEGGQEEFIAIQLRNGRPWFVFDPQGCVVAVTIETPEDENRTFSDNQWHHLFVRRELTTGRMNVDRTLSGEKESICATGNIIGRNTGVYIGGVPDDYILQRSEEDDRSEVMDKAFMGCLRNVKILMTTSPEETWVDLNWTSVVDQNVAMQEWEGCPANQDKGIHFWGTGYLLAPGDDFSGGNIIEFIFSMRTEYQNGMLFFVHGSGGVYFLVQIVAGGIHWQMSDGTKTLVFLFPNDQVPGGICDGKWHTFKMNKFGEELAITVDVRYSMSNGGSKRTPFNNPWQSLISLGGIKPRSEEADFIKEHGVDAYLQNSFGGCLDAMKISRRPFDVIPSALDAVNVNMDGCPELQDSYTSCQVQTKEVVYRGLTTSTVEDMLPPFTEYLYQVEVMNEAGSAFSPWGVGRTREGAPRGLAPPYDVTVLNGFTITAKWFPPEEHTGQLTKYILRGYNRDNLEEPAAEAVFEDTTILQGRIADAVPFTNYTIVVGACTFGGCTESEGVDVFTNEEAPGGVHPPEIVSAGGYHLELAWKQPDMPNGILTGYFLYMEDVELYNGVSREFNVTELDVYTAYRFYVKVCSRAGCNTSDTVSLSTAQLPPTFVDPPTLAVLGKYRIHVQWEHPLQMNGVLDRYLLYSSFDRESLGEAVYNSSELFTHYTLDNLYAGTTYFIRVSACTYGGCTMSNYTAATTEESAPEGVRSPLVSSPDPNTLHINWDIPERPNGVILMYKLYHNGLVVYEDPVIREHDIRNLEPWSLHFLKVEACTDKGCASSDEISARTQEAPPVGNIGLDLRVDDPRTVSVKWNPVSRPNGMLYYDVYFEGFFYADPENWDYNLVTERRSLYQNVSGGGSWIPISPVVPFSDYYVQVNASNTRGFILSNTKLAEMPAGSPDGVKPPELTSPDPTSIRAIWTNVGRSNSAQDPTFQLQFRDLSLGSQISNLFPQPTTSTTFLKQGLVAYTSYDFRLVANNFYGSTPSSWISLMTKQDRPGSIDPPKISNVQTRSLDVEWDFPFPPNGIITEYRIYQNGELEQTVPGNTTIITIDGLTPFVEYIYKVEACTIAGCTMSANSAPAYTMKAPPEGVQAPVLRSTTPTSVLVVWAAPQFPNGDILQYAIHRREKGEEADVTVVRTFLVTDPTEFLDESRELSPFTTYEYRIVATTSVGSGESDWAEVTTKSSRPGGVLPPGVEILSPTSATVTWKSPISLNGRLESYVISFPRPRFEIFNTSQLSLTVTNLIPYTMYSIVITACSDGGCSESAPTVITTSPSVPDEITPPVPTSHSQTFVSITWLPPDRPNGPNVRYELARMKIRQPLQPGATDFGTWASIYNGLAQYYEDRGLTIFTTYMYRVTVYNDFGHTISDPSIEVTTFGGSPTEPPLVVANPVSHTSINVTWINPTVFEMQGGPSKFMVNLTSAIGDESSYDYAGDQTSAVIASLRPNTRYTVTVTLVVHGGAMITSYPVFVTTGDGAPEGVKPPVYMVFNETTLAVSWEAPDKSNGQVVAYYLHVDGFKMDTGMNTPGTYYLYDLLPYTIYNIQLEVCTIYACVKSVIIKATTAESVPGGIGMPSLTVLSPHSIDILWNPPSRPNGVILNYELLRKAKVPCNELEPTMPVMPAGKCTYFECGILESFCGNNCYSGPKTCCDGVVHNNKQGYECCGTTYIPRRTDLSDVCCGGKFYNLLPNHECCGGRYVEVRPGHICCPDATQDRVDVGPGDMCCGSIPYDSAGSQICCDKQLKSGYGRQCCGGVMSSDKKLCCGNATIGQAHEPELDKFCCGSQYADSATSVCCADETGQNKVHSYGTAQAKSLANEKCCGKERISAGLSCCNGIGYNSFSQRCADVSNMDSGCGSGTICPTSQEASAFCNRCNFNRGSHKCGSYSKLVQHKPTTITESPGPSAGALCLTEAVKIYTGSQLKFTEENLAPYTEYHYSVVAVNGAGRTEGDYAKATTLQKLPEGVHPPTARIDTDQLDTIYLSWTTPEKPNGEILYYSLLRENIEIFRDRNVMEYMDNNAIQPYNTYKYKLRVCNSAGCVTSDEIKVATLQAKPEQLNPPIVRVESSSTIHVQWTTPIKPNGYIVNYVLYQDDAMVANVSGNTFDFLLTSLLPYTEYTYLISACTDVGCTNSSGVSATTQQAKPQGVLAPYVVIINVNIAEVHWSKPTTPNGEIVLYILYRSTGLGPYSVLNTTTGDWTMYMDYSLQPGAQYTYILQANSEAGGTNSTGTTITVPLVTPQGIPPPKNVTILDAYSMYIEWDGPSMPNGVIDQYFVLLNAGTATEVKTGVGLAEEHIAAGLLPYTEYSVRIQACVSGVDNGCGTGPSRMARTLQAAPQNQPPPTLTALGPSLVRVEWDAPTNPNGVITQYQILRRNLGAIDPGILIQVVRDPEERSFNNAGPELIPYTEYEYRVVAVNSEGDTTSPWVTVRTLAAPPQVIYAPTVANIGAYSFSVSWQPPIQANGIITVYRLEYKAIGNDPTSPSQTMHVSVSGTQTSSSISGLTPYTPYQVRIVAVNAAGSVASPWTRTNTGQTSPAFVGPFEVEKIANGESIILRWNIPAKPNGAVNNYLIYEQDNVNPIYQGLSRVFEYRRLKPYTQYTVQLEACTIGGCGRSNLQSFYTAEIPPQNQAAPTVGPVNSTHVTLGWTKPVNAYGKITSYEVLRRSNGKRAKRAISDPVVVYRTTATDADNYEYVDSGLEPYSTYDYKIRATNSRGFTESPWQSVETLPSPPAGVIPPLVSQVGNNHDQLRVTWEGPTNPNGVIKDYKIQRNNSAPWSFTSDQPREYIDKGLLAFTLYAYTLTVCTLGGCTTSAPSFLRTPETAPLTVAPPTVVVLDSTTLRVQWTTPQISNGQIRSYRLYKDNAVIYDGTDMSYVVTNLIPYRAYTFLISACTNGGCTDSSSVIGRAQEASPSGMRAPTLRVTSSNSIEIAWQPPDQPNGVITSYELRRDGTLLQTTTGFQYVDLEVDPGTEYIYKVTVYNSRGSVTSPPAAVRTYASAPVGLAAPLLEALSSTSVKATWEPPLKPNGDIYNYTLFKDNEIVFSERQLTTVVTGLDHWTEYSFRVQACTSQGCTTSDATRIKTKEAPPLGLSGPKLTSLADSSGAHAGVLVEWAPPRRPNGIINRYDIYRRNYTAIGAGLTGGPRKMIYSGLAEQYQDRDSELQPYTEYEYMVMAANSEGLVSSSWERVRTKEAPPEDVPPPSVKEVSETTITLTIKDPVKPNGYIESYNVYLNSQLVLKSRSTLIIVGEVNPLIPYTRYTVYIEACTAGGCTKSPAIETRTKSELPGEILPPVVSNITSVSMDVAWQPPAQPNGPVLLYELSMRQACPYPYADNDDEVTIDCESGLYVSKANGDVFAATITGLDPYTRYEFWLQVRNEGGGVKDALSTVMATTLPAPPLYVKSRPPQVLPRGDVVIVTWLTSFMINGEVERFTLFKNGQVEYSGSDTSYQVYREDRYQSFEFQVKLITREGEAETDVLIFDPSKGVVDPVTDGPTELPVSSSTPIYQEIWFIVVVAIVALIILFLGIFICLRCNRQKVPYIRERMPLQPQQKKAQVPLGYGMEFGDDSYFNGDIPQPPPSHLAHSNGTDAHVGYVNPAYSHLSIPSASASLVDLNLDKLSHKGSSKWDDDEDLPEWNSHLPIAHDSGLHSLAYGDDYDADSDRPISVLKEHTMFTDTHL